MYGNVNTVESIENRLQLQFNTTKAYMDAYASQLSATGGSENEYFQISFTTMYNDLSQYYYNSLSSLDLIDEN